MNYHDTSQAYIACLQVENAELRQRLTQLDAVCRGISQAIATKPLDDHGNADRREWLNKVLETAKDALETAGYRTMPLMEAWSQENPGEVEDVDIPQFVKERA